MQSDGKTLMEPYRVGSESLTAKSWCSRNISRIATLENPLILGKSAQNRQGFMVKVKVFDAIHINRTISPQPNSVVLGIVFRGCIPPWQRDISHCGIQPQGLWDMASSTTSHHEEHALLEDMALQGWMLYFI